MKIIGRENNRSVEEIMMLSSGKGLNESQNIERAWMGIEYNVREAEKFVAKEEDV